MQATNAKTVHKTNFPTLMLPFVRLFQLVLKIQLEVAKKPAIVAWDHNSPNLNQIAPTTRSKATVNARHAQPVKSLIKLRLYAILQDLQSDVGLKLKH